MSFVLVKIEFDTSWYRLSGDILSNRYGGYCDLLENDVILETDEESKDFYELDWTKTTLIKPDSEGGWLTPDGTWYGCSYRDHAEVADLVFHKTEWELEELGYARVKSTNVLVELYKRRLTADQRNWLSLRGYEFCDDIREYAKMIDNTIMEGIK
jgi:hypothetical protein